MADIRKVLSGSNGAPSLAAMLLVYPYSVAEARSNAAIIDEAHTEAELAELAEPFPPTDKADPDWPFPLKMTPLHVLALGMQGPVQTRILAQALVRAAQRAAALQPDAEYALDARDAQGRTAAELALDAGNHNVLEPLLSANVDTQTAAGKTLWQHAEAMIATSGPHVRSETDSEAHGRCYAALYANEPEEAVEAFLQRLAAARNTRALPNTLRGLDLNFAHVQALPKFAYTLMQDPHVFVSTDLATALAETQLPLFRRQVLAMPEGFYSLSLSDRRWNTLYEFYDLEAERYAAVSALHAGNLPSAVELLDAVDERATVRLAHSGGTLLHIAAWLPPQAIDSVLYAAQHRQPKLYVKRDAHGHTPLFQFLATRNHKRVGAYLECLAGVEIAVRQREPFRRGSEALLKGYHKVISRAAADIAKFFEVLMPRWSALSEDDRAAADRTAVRLLRSHIVARLLDLEQSVLKRPVKQNLSKIRGVVPEVYTKTRALLTAALTNKDPLTALRNARVAADAPLIPPHMRNVFD